MSTGKDIANAAPKYLGVPYSTIDCQAFVERVLRDCGISKDLPGSNAWFREVMKNGWVGTPEECKKAFGSIPVGAFLFILEHDGKEPAKYKDDGIGNASHIGIYTGMTGKQMASISGVANASQYIHGDGAIHSSASRGCVCTSKFHGKSINGGWNRVGLWDRIEYGGKKPVEVTYKAKVVGGALNMRAEPSTSAARICQIPDGEIVTVTEDLAGWSKVIWQEKTGYVMTQYLEEVQEPEEMVSVPRSELLTMKSTIEKWLRG